MPGDCFNQCVIKIGFIVLSNIITRQSDLEYTRPTIEKYKLYQKELFIFSHSFIFTGQFDDVETEDEVGEVDLEKGSQNS